MGFPIGHPASVMRSAVAWFCTQPRPVSGSLTNALTITWVLFVFLNLRSEVAGRVGPAGGIFPIDQSDRPYT